MEIRETIFKPTPAQVEASVKGIVESKAGKVIKAPSAAALKGAQEFPLDAFDGPDAMKKTAYLTTTNKVLEHVEGGLANLDVWKSFGQAPVN